MLPQLRSHWEGDDLWEIGHAGLSKTGRTGLEAGWNWKGYSRIERGAGIR